MQEDEDKNENSLQTTAPLFSSPLFQPQTTQCLSLGFLNPFKSSDDSATTRPRSSGPKNALRRFTNFRQLDVSATKAPLESKYVWHKDKTLGIGSYGNVYLATNKETKEQVALKQIPKQNTNSVSFQQEMRAMLYIKGKGGHPHLCSLHEHFDAKNDYYVIMDAIRGGEMFDHLIDNGAFSEMDASRLIREVASALNFLHGIGVVHADLKPENLLLTTSNRGDSMVKLVDFGCAQLLEHADEDFAKVDYEPTYGAPTPAYCPKESIDKTLPIQPSADMWALGVILFIMLTGAHPFDLEGEATDEEIERRIQDPRYRIPIDSPNVTGHLSRSAKDLLRKLMHRDPEQRLTALQMLQHPWTKGETASTTKIEGSGPRLATVRRFKTKLQAKFFETAIIGSDADTQIRRKKSLIETGYQESQKALNQEGGPEIDMSSFSSLLSDSIKHRHFPANHVVYEEGDRGDHMYFIESGSIEVVTKDHGSIAVRSQGDFFGEGALLKKHGRRSATIRCQTPVHALEITREYFDKYVSQADAGLLLTLKEKDKIRKRNRVKTILSLQENMKPITVGYKKPFFRADEADADCLYILEKGKVDVGVGKNIVFAAYPGNIFGEYSVLTRRPRNCDAVCVSRGGCTAQILKGEDFRKLAEGSPYVQATLRDLQLRREFKKAVVRRLKKEFPYQNPKEAFQAADQKGVGYLDKESLTALMRESSTQYTDGEINEILEALSLTTSGRVTYDDFKKIFIGDRRTAESM